MFSDVTTVEAMEVLGMEHVSEVFKWQKMIEMRCSKVYLPVIISHVINFTVKY